MSPALTKTLGDCHGNNLSAPPASIRRDSNRLQLESGMRSTWISPTGPDAPTDPVLSLFVQTTLCSHCDTLLLLSCKRESQQEVSVVPGGADMFLVSIAEYNSQEVYLLRGQSAAPKCGPDGVDVHDTPLPPTAVSPPYSDDEVGLRHLPLWSDSLDSEQAAWPAGGVEASKERFGGPAGLQDVEATASSSSDEEQDQERIHGRAETSAVCEGQWLEERAELGSRWSWLQLRVCDLDERIRRMGEIHRHIRSTKGGVVLAEPRTDRHIQQSLLREMAGLSFTALDADMEPCSPTRLLHNIERQSAQLNHIVNSLMAPLALSPPSKQTQMWKGKSGLRADEVFSSTRRRTGVRRRQLFNTHVSCARSRPVITYHKPKLFTLSSESLWESSASSRLTSPSRCCCSSREPVVLCSDRRCSSRMLRSTYTHSSHRAPKTGEEWFLKPLVVNVQPSSPEPSRRSSPPLHHRRKHKQRARRHKTRAEGVSVSSPLCRTTAGRRRKRRYSCRLRGGQSRDEGGGICPEERSWGEVSSFRQYTHNQVSQGECDTSSTESSLTKDGKLQSKDILTPSWRVVDVQSSLEKETDDAPDEGQTEVVTDEVFAQRHWASEQQEKLLRFSWGKRKCCRRTTRSGSRLSSGGGGEKRSVEWSSAQLDTDEQPSSEEWLCE